VRVQLPGVVPAEEVCSVTQPSSDSTLTLPDLQQPLQVHAAKDDGTQSPYSCCYLSGPVYNMITTAITVDEGNDNGSHFLNDCPQEVQPVVRIGSFSARVANSNGTIKNGNNL